MASSVLAIVPHYRCEPWLADAIESLLNQTRPVDAIVVIDDASPEPPIDIVSRYPNVTLLQGPENSGPYRWTQGIIEQTDYECIMFGDSDDWSMPMRLEVLLRTAHRTGAELVGSQAVRIIGVDGEVIQLRYPTDVHQAAHRRAHASYFCNGSTIMSRDLVMRIGGFATGMPFGGDTEFQLRAEHAARVTNVPDHLYVMRARPRSLTASRETGLGTPARTLSMRLTKERAEANRERVNAGELPDLTTLASLPPLPIRHICGPRLRAAGGGEWPR